MSQQALLRPSRTPRTARPTKAAARPSLRVVDAGASTHPPSHAGYVMLCLALVVAGLLAALVINTSRAEGTYRLGALNSTATELHDEKVTLQARYQELSSPTVLASRASELGLVSSPSTAVVRLSDGELLGVASSIDPDDGSTVVVHAEGLTAVTESTGDSFAPEAASDAPGTTSTTPRTTSEQPTTQGG